MKPSRSSPPSPETASRSRSIVRSGAPPRRRARAAARIRSGLPRIPCPCATVFMAPPRSSRSFGRGEAPHARAVAVRTQCPVPSPPFTPRTSMRAARKRSIARSSSSGVEASATSPSPCRSAASRRPVAPWRWLRRERGLFTMPIPPMSILDPVDPPLEVVLVSPQIPPNTGNVARTCAVTGSRLHLVGPLGFSLDEKDLRRAGLDYWQEISPEVHRDWPEFEARALRGQTEKLHLFSARAGRSLFQVTFAPGDFLVFGQEQLGLPPALLDAWPERQVAIPMRAGMRSLNLAVAAGVGLYAALASAAGVR